MGHSTRCSNPRPARMDTDPVRLIRVVRRPSNVPSLPTAEPHSAAEYGTANMASTDRNRLALWLDEGRRAATEQVGDHQTYEGEEWSGATSTEVLVFIEWGWRWDRVTTLRTEDNIRRCHNKHDEVNGRAINLRHTVIYGRKSTKSSANGRFNRCRDQRRRSSQLLHGAQNGQGRNSSAGKAFRSKVDDCPQTGKEFWTRVSNRQIWGGNSQLGGKTRRVCQKGRTKDTR